MRGEVRATLEGHFPRTPVLPLAMVLLSSILGIALGAQAPTGADQRTLDQVVASLRATSVEEMNPALPQQTQVDHRRLVTLLEEGAVRALGSWKDGNVEKLRQALTVELSALVTKAPRADAPRAQKAREERPFGRLLSLDIGFRPEAPGFLYLLFSLSEECGTNDVLLLFRQEASHWQPVLTVVSDPFAEQHSFEGMVVKLSAPGKGGGRLLAIAASVPWCTSAWNSLYYWVYRLNDMTTSPLLLKADSIPFYRSRDPEPFSLQVYPDNVEILFETTAEHRLTGRMLNGKFSVSIQEVGTSSAR